MTTAERLRAALAELDTQLQLPDADTERAAKEWRWTLRLARDASFELVATRPGDGCPEGVYHQTTHIDLASIPGDSANAASLVAALTDAFPALLAVFESWTVRDTPSGPRGSCNADALGDIEAVSADLDPPRFYDAELWLEGDWPELRGADVDALVAQAEADGVLLDRGDVASTLESRRDEWMEEHGEG